MFVFAEDRIDSGGSISHTHVSSRDFVKLPESTRSGLEDGYLSDVFQQCSWLVETFTLTKFVLGGLSFPG